MIKMKKLKVGNPNQLAEFMEIIFDINDENVQNVIERNYKLECIITNVFTLFKEFFGKIDHPDKLFTWKDWKDKLDNKQLTDYTELKNYNTAYIKSAEVNYMIYLYDKLILLENEIKLRSIDFLNSTMDIKPFDSNFSLTYFCQVNKIYKEGDNAHKKDLVFKKLNEILNYAVEFEKVYFIPYVDVDLMFERFSSGILNFKKHIQRCDDAFKLINNSVEKFKEKFPNYYRSFLRSADKNPVIIIEGFFGDVQEIISKHKRKIHLIRQLKIISEFFKSQINQSKINNPLLTSMLNGLDEQFKKLESEEAKGELNDEEEPKDGYNENDNNYNTIPDIDVTEVSNPNLETKKKKNRRKKKSKKNIITKEIEQNIIVDQDSEGSVNECEKII